MVVNDQIIENFDSFNQPEPTETPELEATGKSIYDEESYIPSTYYESENFITKEEHYVLSYDFGYDLTSILHPTRSTVNVESQIDSTPPVNIEKDDRLYALVAFAISWFMAVLNASSVYMTMRILRTVKIMNGKETLDFYWFAVLTIKLQNFVKKSYKPAIT